MNFAFIKSDFFFLYNFLKKIKQNNIIPYIFFFFFFFRFVFFSLLRAHWLLPNPRHHRWCDDVQTASTLAATMNSARAPSLVMSRISYGKPNQLEEEPNAQRRGGDNISVHTSAIGLCINQRILLMMKQSPKMRWHKKLLLWGVAYIAIIMLLVSFLFVYFLYNVIYLIVDCIIGINQ